MINVYGIETTFQLAVPLKGIFQVFIDKKNNLFKSIAPSKEIEYEEPYYNLIFSFTWAGLAAFHKASTI
jgi:hypothetical protein